MPFKSQAQRRLFYAKGKSGEIPMETVHEWEEETKRKKSLPAKLEKKSSIGFLKSFENNLGESTFVTTEKKR